MGVGNKFARPSVGGGYATGFHPIFDASFMSATLDPRFTFVRASIGTDGFYTDAAGSGYNSFASGVPRLNASRGILLENTATNRLLNSDTPATQTTTSLTTGSWTLWVIGTGSATPSAGTATITGAAAATAGSPNTFTVTVAGTVTVTVAGSLTRFQLEQASFPTSYVPTVGSVVTRNADSLTASLGAWFNASAGTLWSEQSVTVGVAIQPALITLDDGTANNKIMSAVNSSSHLFSAVTNAGTSTNTFLANTITLGQVFREATTYDASGEATAAFGAVSSKVALPAGGVPVVTTLRVSGSNLLNQQLNYYMRRVRYYNRVLSNSELSLVTT